MRGETINATGTSKCRRKHLLTPDTIRIGKYGRVECRICAKPKHVYRMAK